MKNKKQKECNICKCHKIEEEIINKLATSEISIYETYGILENVKMNIHGVLCALRENDMIEKQMKCKHDATIKLEVYGEEECLQCGASLDTSDPTELMKDGTPKKEAQKKWDIYRKKENNKNKKLISESFEV